MAGRKTFKARFIPKNPGKYVGNPNRIFMRSAWEGTVMTWLDQNNAVLQWSSEELGIPYVNPVMTDQNGRPKISMYYPDFLVRYKDRTGAIKTEIIEVKPMRETKLLPGATNQEKMIYAVNAAKWKAADEYATRNGAKFRVVTEMAIFYRGKRSKK
jgi:hypothetical protein